MGKPLPFLPVYRRKSIPKIAYATYEKAEKTCWKRTFFMWSITILEKIFYIVFAIVKESLAITFLCFSGVFWWYTLQILFISLYDAIFFWVDLIVITKPPGERFSRFSIGFSWLIFSCTVSFLQGGSYVTNLGHNICFFFF